MRLFRRPAPEPVLEAARPTSADPDADLTAELLERARVWLARDDAIARLGRTDPRNSSTRYVLDDYLERIGLP